MTQLKWLLVVVFLLFSLAEGIYLVYKLQVSDMTLRQYFLQRVYPVIMKMAGKTATRLEQKGVQPPLSFYTLQAVQNNDSVLDFSAFRGKKVLLVNTASDCGYTGQYAELEELHRRFPGAVVVLGFPANDFKEQEKGDDATIAQFCKRNYGVSFPIFKKASVIKGTHQHPVYRWLTDPAQNGWNSKTPSWNFSKYLVNEAGELTHYFDPAVSPLGEEVIQALEQ
ncbi:MAG TPA: glutathione peroxidase [Lacibacter sp.]|nr:glutathione peroxidase [Lacibacter sp.]HMO88592.1 glutathione peroxidase [Lacibacter sp.]HMP87570.1 glutathione peroxidase [Lacibacter sp.]